MFVEKLSLFGFKSFNQKVKLEFDAGISGVIGPNGCGKSNIVDAMRWVLGEQSTKQLRGAKMEDVIFNGTREEKPLSIAEVELTLNNDRGKLPIDYSTVTVARRLYRSGLSEYLINGQIVRLRDVRELFMDTGMGSHAYSVIERQMVDNILSDTTGHRRFLFEEAAGIMKYKTRKKEAVNKLDATERDLLRLSDIISEIERQVNSLKRQVGKARRYRTLMDEAKSLDLGLSQRQRSEWLAGLQALDGKYRESLQGAESGETEVSTLEANLQKLHLAVLEEEKKLSGAREHLAQVDDEIGQANSRILVLRERLDATRMRIKEADEHKVRLTDRRERNTAAMSEVEARLETLSRREAEEREVLDGREAALSQVESRVHDVRAQVANAKNESARLRDERIRAEAEVESSARRLEDLRLRLETETVRLGEAQTRREQQEQALEVSRANLKRAQERVEELEEDQRVLITRRENHGARTDLLRTQLAEKRAEEAGIRSRLATLEDLRANYEGFDPGVRALMLEENRDPGIVGTLADLVHIPEAWVAALEPALSGAWQFLVVSNTDTATRLVERLRRDSLGFGCLLPLDRVPEAGAGESGLTWASEIVETEPAHRNLVRFLFGDLALVEDLGTALDLVKSGRASRAATRMGEFVDATVVAGGEGGPAGSELVEREEGLARCRKEIDGILTVLSELTHHEGELKVERHQLEGRLTELQEELKRAQEIRAEMQKEEAGLAGELQHVNEGLSNREEEKFRLEELLTAARGEIEAGGVRLKEIAGSSESADQDLEGHEIVLGEIETEREAVLGTVHELRMAWAKLEGELQDGRSTQGRLGSEREEFTAEWERTVRDREEAELRVGEIETELESIAERIQELHVVREERSQVVAEREREKSEVSAREHQDSEALREVRRRAIQSREEAHASELKLSEIKSELKHLEERLFQEYEVTPDDLSRVEIDELPDDAGRVLAELKDRIRRMGPVNLLAVEEYEEKSQRFEFMSTQRDDLLRARDTLNKTINEINKTASGMFLETFALVQENFQKTFKILFQGGECSLELTGDDPLEADISVTARPRGKKPQGIHQLSSGERALTAIALLFAIYLVKPSPFCILDEVDAPLDDANIDRFVAMVKEFSKRTQFIVITHNKKTMESADCLYGVTMQRPGVSSVVSVKLDGARAEGLGERAAAGDGNGAGNGNGSRVDDPEPLSPESVIAQ